MIYFKTQDGKKGALDVVMMLQGEGYLPYGVENGNVLFTSQDGKKGMFSLAEYAIQEGIQIDKIDGFNAPPTALDVPPLGMNNLDQSVFFMGGGKIDALKEMFPQATELSDGRIVVLDKDGLWKTMWSDTWSAPEAFPNYDEMVEQGQAVDTRIGMKGAGIAFLFGLSGVDPVIGKTGDVTPESVTDMLSVLSKNVPQETKLLLGKIVSQTTGLDEWKFTSALCYPKELGVWLRLLLDKTSFQYRMKQTEMTEILVKSLHNLAISEFSDSLAAIGKQAETKNLTINLKEVIDEFIQTMDSLDVIRDMSKITGLTEWKDMAEDVSVDQSKLPPMPAFVPKLVRLLKWVFPISKNKALYITKGKRGLDAIASLMVMADNCMYSLSDVPDSVAKQKMFMALKTLQTRIENKLSFSYHPIGDKTGEKINLFMEAKSIYSEKREVVYKLIQSPKESWSKTIMEAVRKEPNLEAFYETLPNEFAQIMQSFIAMDVAYDMQPWIDTNYQMRTNDPFAMMQDSYGPPPPEYGYLAENSPRAALNIIETLTQSAAMVSDMQDSERKMLLRSPMAFANLMRMIQTASVRREIGTVETLTKMGLSRNQDPYKSVDPYRIWDDPAVVRAEQQQQMEEMMAQMQAEMKAMEDTKLAENQQVAETQMAAQQGAAPSKGGKSPTPASGEANGASMGGMMAGTG